MVSSNWPTLEEYLIDDSWSDGFSWDEAAAVEQHFESKLNSMSDNEVIELFERVGKLKHDNSVSY